MSKVYTPEERIAWMKSLPSNPAGAAMLIETEDKRLLIVKANYKKHWSLPGGVIDKGESPLQAAIRETKEEVGLDIAPDEVQFAGVIFNSNPEVDLYRFVFCCTITNEQTKSILPQESEIEEYALETAEQITSTERRYAPPIMLWASGEEFPIYSEEKMEIV